MKAASAALQAFLESRQPYWSADLFTFSLTNGVTLRLTGAEVPISFGGNTWQPASAINFGLTRSGWSIKNTLDVPSLDINLVSSGSDYDSGANIKLAMHNGLLDGSYIEMDRAFMQILGGPGYGNTAALGVVAIFAGPCGQIEVTATGAKITVRGANVRHQQYMPKNRFLSNCIHSLYDPGCTKNRSDYTFSGTVSSANAVVVNWSSDPTGGNYSDLPNGYIIVTSGVAAGTKRTILAANSLGVSLIYPFYEIPAVGDSFTVTYGCDKTYATCGSRFSNQQHYRGFPYVPPAETGLVA